MEYERHAGLFRSHVLVVSCEVSAAMQASALLARPPALCCRVGGVEVCGDAGTSEGGRWMAVCVVAKR